VSNWSGQEILYLSNPAAITSLSITINVQQQTGVTSNGAFNSFPGGYLMDNNGASGGVISYTYVLTNGTIWANYPGDVGANWNGAGYPHSSANDTWTVTSTSNGITSTLTGHF